MQMARKKKKKKRRLNMQAVNNGSEPDSEPEKVESSLNHLP